MMASGREAGSFVNTIFSEVIKRKNSYSSVPGQVLWRIRGAERATAIIEYFRDKGKNVLLIADCLHGCACSKRNWTCLGEQPTSKGYPPSVVSMIPRLIERTGSAPKIRNYNSHLHCSS